MLFKTGLLKGHCSMCKLLLDSAATAINHDSFKFMEYTVQETAVS